jgi:DNA-binding NtrC family response regulator
MGRLRSVLVVDDDRAMREMIISLLRDRRIDARGAESVDAALSALRGNPVDAILSDIRMPERDGFELLRVVRELQPETPVLLMSSFGGEAHATLSERAGAAAYLSKPFQPSELSAALERALDPRPQHPTRERRRTIHEDESRLPS